MIQDYDDSFDRESFSTILREKVNEAFTPVGLPLDRVEELVTFGLELVDTSRSLNLTRILDPEGVAIRHFLDSTYLLPFLKNVKRPILDVGTGGGVPGMPLAIMRKDLRIVMLDCTRKKILFIKECIEKLGLKNARVAHEQMEEHLKSHKYHAALFRASIKPAAAMEKLTITGPSVNMLLFMEGSSGPQRAKAVRGQAKRAGYLFDKILPYKLPGMDKERYIVCFRKR